MAKTRDWTTVRTDLINSREQIRKDIANVKTKDQNGNPILPHISYKKELQKIEANWTELIENGPFKPI